jgi:tRNA (adenine-N(1)-)-methyltransferase non-catalytic subunit
LTSYLRDSKDYIAPSLTEPTLRRYQVLPGRTHPDMNGMVHGGYILHAYRILATNETFTRPDRPVKVKGKRKRAEEDSTA